jgi:hypothetical protein
MRSKKLLISLALVFLMGVAGGLAYYYWVNSPRYALQQMALALKTRNMDNFFKYLDLKAIFSDFLRAASAETNQSKERDADEWNRLARQMGQKFAHYFLPKLFGALESPIRGLIEQYLSELDNKHILGIAAAATVAQIDRQGDEAQVTVIDPKNQEPFRFQMHRRPQDGCWQIIAVNYQDVKKFYQREFEKR